MSANVYIYTYLYVQIIYIHDYIYIYIYLYPYYLCTAPVTNGPFKHSTEGWKNCRRSNSQLPRAVKVERIDPKITAWFHDALIDINDMNKDYRMLQWSIRFACRICASIKNMWIINVQSTLSNCLEHVVSIRESYSERWVSHSPVFQILLSLLQ